MTAKLEHPKGMCSRDKLKDYHKHCNNIAMIVSKTELLREVESRIQKYLLAVGVITT